MRRRAISSVSCDIFFEFQAAKLRRFLEISANFATVMELTKAIIKEVSALDDARTRRESGLFKAEGTKCVGDTLGHFEVVRLLATSAWLEANAGKTAGIDKDRIITAPRRDFDRMSHLSTAPEVIAVYRIPESSVSPADASRQLILALDGIQDPGNLGTIMRTADWFGIRIVVCSQDCADPYSPKAVMATMGAISRVKAVRTDLAAFLKQCDAPIYGTSPRGTDLYDSQIENNGVIVMGSEGHGMTEAVEATLTHRLRIPSFPPDTECSESLNVASATAIIVSEFRRRWQN